MIQHGFFFDQGRCIGCHTCAVACKDWNDLPPGPAKYLRVYEWQEGSFPSVGVHLLAIQCYHCSNPVCVDACPNGAIYKEETYGSVLVDQEKCQGTRMCSEACPYGAITYENDGPEAKANKCNMCIDKLHQDQKPICALACPMRALDFGPLEELREKYGELQELRGLPDGGETDPSVVFRPRIPKKKLVPYDEKRAVELLARRDPLPPLFDPSTGLEDREGRIRKNRLVLRPTSAEDLLYYTRDDHS